MAHNKLRFIRYIRAGVLFPNRHQHGRHLPCQFLDGYSLLPPTVGIKIAVARAGNSDFYVLREYVGKDVASAPRVEVGGHQNYAAPFLLLRRLRRYFCFFASVVGVVRYAQDLVFRHAALNQVMLYQFRDAGVGAQATAACDNDGAEPLPVDLRGTRSAVGIKIVIAEDKNRVGAL